LTLTIGIATPLFWHTPIIVTLELFGAALWTLTIFAKALILLDK